MTVDTPSAGDTPFAGDWAVGAETELDIEAAVVAGEAVLARRFGSAVTLVDPEALAGSGPATVVRARVASASFSLPRTLVIKHYPDVPPSGETDPFAQEAVSYQLFTALAPEDRTCPELLAHDGTKRVLVIDDLGRLPTVEDILHDNDSRAAERALLSWARTLGKMHASTAGREADFNALLRRLGARWHDEDASFAVACAQLPVLLEETVGVSTPAEVRHRAERAAERARSTAFRAFSPVDLSPDNNLVTPAGVRFLDFEQGRVRNALADAAWLRVPFAASAAPLALPVGMREAMIAAWRAEVVAVWPALANDDTFTVRLLDSQLLYLWMVTWQKLPTLDQPGERVLVGGNGPAELVSWWRDLAKQAELAGVTDVAAHAAEVAARLDDRYGPGLELPLYPAFR